ncbi:MAG: MCP four helix bundle domain-containing protein, partial [Candidatus Thermoplasmatota archaeon]|nr:MCP four helix bundle domain-containing protein [Candidatus Thermoplasmatota archaeon]
MKLGMKLYIAFIIVILLGATTAIASFVSINSINNSIDKMGTATLIQDDLRAARQSEKNFIIRGDEIYVGQVENHTLEINDRCEELKGTISTSEEKKSVDSIETASNDYQSAFDNYVDLVHQQSVAGVTMAEKAQAFIGDRDD